MKPAKIIFISACMIGYSLTGVGQIKSSPYEVGISLGAGLYAGDLTPTFLSAYKSPGLFFGINGSKKLSDTYALQAELSFGRVKANEANYKAPAYRQQRNLNFKTSVTELAAYLVVTPFGRERRLSPYVFAGGGINFLKVRRDYSNFNAEYFSGAPAIGEGLKQDIAHSLPRIKLVLPIGAGIRYSLNKNLSLDIKTSYRVMSTDYLDGFSKAANPGKKDYYFTHTIGLIYSFGEKNTLACPK